MAAETPGDDRLLERLQESASGEVAMRQLRRRYDLLRGDYQRLIDRLGELEARLGSAGGAPAPPPARARLATALIAPVEELRDEYASAAAGISRIVEGLGTLAASAFQGPEPAGKPAEGQPASVPPASEPPARWRGVAVDVEIPDFDALLAFQERLTATEGVRRVSISAIEDDLATLLVELDEA